MATNRQDTLDPALLRPGRLDRKIEFPLPSRRERRLIFQTVTSKMNLGPDVDLEDCERVLIFLKSSLTFLSRRFTAGPLVICRNQFSRASCRFTGYSTKLSFVFTMTDQNSQLFEKIAMSFFPLTLKKRGRCVISPTVTWTCFLMHDFPCHSKRSREMTRHTSSVRTEIY